MIILDILYDLARTHKDVRGFVYGKAYEKGAGQDRYPLVWVDDPILGTSASDTALRYTVNVDFLGIPKNNEDVQTIQSAAQIIGLSFLERLRQTYRNVASVEAYSFVTLRDYYDDNAAGCRFTYTVVAANPVNLCAEYFDDDKEFVKVKDLPDFTVENPSGCAIFSNKNGLPNFSV